MKWRIYTMKVSKLLAAGIRPELWPLVLNDNAVDTLDRK